MKSRAETPWYIKFLLAFSGWIGAFFIAFAFGFFFVATLNIAEKNLPYIFILLGVILIIFALKYLQNIDSEFKEHFLLATSFVGQALIVASIFILFDYKYLELSFITISIFQIALMLLVKDYLHRAMNAFFASVMLNAFFFKLGIPWIVNYLLIFTIIYLFLNIYYFKDLKRFESIAYGLLFGLLFIIYLNYNSIFSIFGLHFYYYSKKDFFELPQFFSFILYSAIFSYIIYTILKTYDKLQDKKLLILASVASLAVGLIALKIQGVAIGVILMTVGFFISNRLVQGIGILLMIIFTSRYYYNLSETLLYKSINLLIIGLVLLTFRFIFKKLVEVEK